jgi:cell division protein FtsB
MSIHATIMLASTVLVLVLGMVRGDQTLLNYFRLLESRDVLAETVESLEKENEALRYEMKKIRHSPNYARRVLREKYHVTEPNEKIIFFAD